MVIYDVVKCILFVFSIILVCIIYLLVGDLHDKTLYVITNFMKAVQRRESIKLLKCEPLKDA